MADEVRHSEVKNNDKLVMSFDPHTIEHLGVKMYANIPNAIAELIANAYDADASIVNINLIDSHGEKSIQVNDDGVGMDFTEINTKFLRIGRKRRNEENQILSPSGNRKVTGKKGLGKLAFFGIGNSISISTIKENSGECIQFLLDWNEIINSSETEYQPHFSTTECSKTIKGTTITLSQLKRKTDFDAEALAVSLSKLFNCFDNTFQVKIFLNGENPIIVDNSLRYQNITSQFTWNFPSFSSSVNSDYDKQNQISGTIFSSEKPLKPGLRGIILFAKGRLVNAPEFFGVSESSHGFSYFTGFLNVDFIDDIQEDVISTDRQSLNWDIIQPALLREFLKKTMSEIERDWRRKRNEERTRNISKQTQVDITSWYSKIPLSLKSNIEPIINNIIEKSELSQEEQTNIVQQLHTIVPEYPYYHWRHIHETVRDASYEDYQKEDYYRATEEAIKRFESTTKSKSSPHAHLSGKDLMSQVFGNGKPLSVTSKYKKTDGSEFSTSTKENIEEGQKFMSMGLMAGVRNPLAHEEKKQLKETDLFTEKDCLDILSLLSHLFRRLNDA